MQSTFRGNTNNALKICIVLKNTGLLRVKIISFQKKSSRLLKFLTLKKKAVALGWKDKCFVRLIFESARSHHLGPSQKKNQKTYRKRFDALSKVRSGRHLRDTAA